MLLNGKAPLPGQIIKLPYLAKTFKELVAKGKDGFYKGRVAQAIVDLIKSKGGKMELEDLANHTSSIVEPIKYTYANDVTLYEVRHFNHIYGAKFSTLLFKCPPNGQGKYRIRASGILTNTSTHRNYCIACVRNT